MTDRELRRMNRKELLELLVASEKENERLTHRIGQLEAQLQTRELRIREAGTLAEAALALNGVLEAADRAAALYLENVKRYADTQCEGPDPSDEPMDAEPPQAEKT